MHVLKLCIGICQTYIHLWVNEQAQITPEEAKPDHSVRPKVAAALMSPAASVIQDAGHRQL